MATDNRDRDMAKKRAYMSKYQATEAQKTRRAARNSARAAMEKRGLVSKGDGKDVDHKVPLSKGGSKGAGNLRVKDRGKNRGHKLAVRFGKDK
jgi:regulator of protease activity HflC (stomatin/prohibitin superfamily)